METRMRATPRILVVDDADVNLKILEKMIKKLGYKPCMATSVKEALQKIEESLPQLVLSDISMPEVDGYEFCTMLKATPLTRDIPVIFISGLDSGADKIRGFEVGGVDFISKPFEEAEVAVRIDTHLKIYEMQHQLEVYNKQLNVTIEEQLKRIEEEQKNILYALAKVAEGGKKINCYSHLENVAENARILAQGMAFSPVFEEQISQSFIDVIGIAAMLHDIGKISIPDSILHKESRLTDSEREYVATHTVRGAEILKEISEDCGKNKFVQMAIEIAQYHHERWNGTGYPKGLAGKDIPLAARIVAVAEIYDTLLHKQYEKPALSQKDALRWMEAESGKRFDPDILTVFLKINRQLRTTVNGE